MATLMRCVAVMCALAMSCGDNGSVGRDAAPGDGIADDGGDALTDGKDADDGAGSHIGGSALGVRAPVQLDLLANGTPYQLVVTEDGAFQFPTRVAADSTYELTTADSQCAVVDGAGTIPSSGDVTSVRLYCIGVVELVDVSFAPAVITTTPAFDPAATVYGGTRPLFMDESDAISITATAAYPSEAEIRIDGVIVPSGQASSPAPLGSLPVEVVVTHGPTPLTRTYAFSPTPVERLEAYVKASDSTAGIGFSGGLGPAFRTGCSGINNGNAVAIDGDLLVVGAPCANASAGAAYVYRRIDTTWTFEAKLVPAVSTAGDQFGAAVAIDGDLVAVGAPYDDTSQADSGAAYVFKRVFANMQAAWQQEAKLKASTIGAEDHFGLAVGLSLDTLVVGAADEDSNATGVGGSENNNSALSSGAAYVFVRAALTSTWSQQAFLKASNTGAVDLFGFAVSVSGDRVVVGAPGEDGVGDATSAAGAAYVFVRSGATWAQEGSLLRASNADPNDALGRAVSIDGDLLALGAAYEDGNGVIESDDSANDAGAVYVFARSGSVWTQEQYVKAASPTAGDEFGTAVAIDRTHLVAGAIGAGSQAGAVFACRRGATTAPYWNEVRMVVPPSAEANDYFGASVALDGDTFVAGAFGEDSSATGVSTIVATDNGATNNAGAVYVFR